MPQDVRSPQRLRKAHSRHREVPTCLVCRIKDMGSQRPSLRLWVSGCPAHAIQDDEEARDRLRGGGDSTGRAAPMSFCRDCGPVGNRLHLTRPRPWRRRCTVVRDLGLSALACLSATGAGQIMPAPARLPCDYSLRISAATALKSGFACVLLSLSISAALNFRSSFFSSSSSVVFSVSFAMFLLPARLTPSHILLWQATCKCIPGTRRQACRLSRQRCPRTCAQPSVCERHTVDTASSWPSKFAESRIWGRSALA